MNMKLTKAQYNVKRLLVLHEGSVIVAHMKITGTRCYRMMSFDHSPITNVRSKVLHHLHQKGIVIRVGNEYMINPEIMEKRKAAVLKRQLKKQITM